MQEQTKIFDCQPTVQVSPSDRPFTTSCPLKCWLSIDLTAQPILTHRTADAF